jgi:hypothetical protein
MGGVSFRRKRTVPTDRDAKERHNEQDAARMAGVVALPRPQAVLHGGSPQFALGAGDLVHRRLMDLTEPQ